VGPVQIQSDEENRIDRQAVGEGVQLLVERPAHVVSADHMIDVVAKRNERCQVDQGIEAPVLRPGFRLRPHRPSIAGPTAGPCTDCPPSLEGRSAGGREAASGIAGIRMRLTRSSVRT